MPGPINTRRASTGNDEGASASAAAAAATSILGKEAINASVEHISYYQWVPFILLAQALAFYSPSLVWHSFNSVTGFDIASIVKYAAAIGASSSNVVISGGGGVGGVIVTSEKRAQLVHHLVEHVADRLECERELRSSYSHYDSTRSRGGWANCLLCGRGRGNYLLGLYLFSKLLFVLNACVQLVALDKLVLFGKFRYDKLGMDALATLFVFDNTLDSFALPRQPPPPSQSQSHHAAQPPPPSPSHPPSSHQQKDAAAAAAAAAAVVNASPRFPRVTMCHFQVRFLGDNVHDYAVQCALPINIFNEKVFVFIWMWLMWMAVAATFSLLVWTWRAVWSTERVRFCRRYLNVRIASVHQSERTFAGVSSYEMSASDERWTRSFVERYLRNDGFVILQLIAANCSETTTAEIVTALWHVCKTNDDIRSVV